MHIDGPILDICAFVYATLAYVVVKFRKRLHWFDPELLLVVFASVAVPPIVAIMASAISYELLNLLKESSRITLFLSGASALFALYDPRRRSPFGPAVPMSK
jgi:cell shape-determining protein MreD